MSRTRGQATLGRGRILACLLLLLLSATLPFLGALRNGFVSDDQTLIEDRIPRYLEHFPFPEAFEQSFWKGSAFDVDRPGEETKDYYRPLVTLSYALDVRLHRENPFGYHLTNVILHAVTTLLVFGIALAAGAVWELALGAGLLFATHPIHASSVAWIAGRTDLLAALFLSLAFWLYQRHARRFKIAGGSSGDSMPGNAAEVAARGRTWITPALLGSLVAYAFALLSKEVAFVFGGWILAYAAAARARARASGEPPPAWPWRDLLLVAAMTVAYVLFRIGVLGLPDFETGSMTATSSFRAGMPAAANAYYWRVFLWPGTLHFHVPPILPTSAVDPLFFSTLLLLFAQLALGVWLLRRAPLAVFGGGLVLLGVLPVSHVVPLAFRTVYCEYWAYVPSIGFALLVAGLCDWWQRGAVANAQVRRRRIALTALVGVSLIGALLLPARAAVYRSEEILLRHTTTVYPKHVDSWVTLGSELAQRGDLVGAEAALRTAARIDPRSRGVWVNLGNLFHLRGQPDSAEVAYRRGIEIFPGKSDARFNLAEILLDRNADEEAIEQYREMVSRNPSDASFVRERGAVLHLDALDPKLRLASEERIRSLRLASGILGAALRVDAANGDLRPEAISTALECGDLPRARAALHVPGARASDPFETLWALWADVEGGSEVASLAGLVRLFRESPEAVAEATRIGELQNEVGAAALAVPIWRALLRADRIEPDRVSHYAARLARDPNRQEVVASAGAIWRMLLEERNDHAFALLNLGSLAHTERDLGTCRLYWQRFLDRYPTRPECADVRVKLAELAASARR